MTRPPAPSSEPAPSSDKDDDLKQRLARLGEEVLAEEVPERLLQALVAKPEADDGSDEPPSGKGGTRRRK